MDDDTITVLALARKGYGSFIEISELDTDDLLDIVEFEKIATAIEYHGANNGSR